jgi:hypothetical protein
VNTTPAQSLPTTPATLTRRLAAGTVAVNLIAIVVAAGLVAFLKFEDRWQTYGVATATAVLAAFASVAVLSMAAGRTVDWLVTFVMGAAAVRLLIALIGLLVAVQGLKLTPTLAAGLICWFYVVTLVTESLMLGRAVRGPAGGTHV